MPQLLKAMTWVENHTKDFTQNEYETKVGINDWDSVNRLLMIALKEKTTGGSRKRVLAAEGRDGHPNGLENFWNLHDWFKSRSGIGI